MPKVLIALCLVASAALAQEAEVKQLMTHELATADGQEVVLLTVEYPPGGSSAPHRHHAYAFVYVLEGQVVMQVEGGDEVTIGPGETFLETPEEVHTVSRNASDTEPARFVVFLVKRQNAPITLPAD